MKSYEEVLFEFYAECEEIADMCEEEGYPATGENYSLRVAELKKQYVQDYPEYFGDDEEEED